MSWAIDYSQMMMILGNKPVNDTFRIPYTHSRSIRPSTRRSCPAFERRVRSTVGYRIPRYRTQIRSHSNPIDTVPRHYSSLRYPDNLR